MYDVGFGDCFLLQFPRVGDPPFRVLVDCGAHRSGYPSEGWKPETTVDQIIADVTAGDGEPNLDVVIATHRHEDHVSGFRALAWADVRVGEVWMPWTEDPKDKEAAEIRNRQSRLAVGLTQAFKGQGFGARWSNANAADALRALVANSLTNEEAMRTLHRGFRGQPLRRFLSADDPDTIRPENCAELTIHVLGPSRDPEVIRDMDPPSGQSYLRYIPQAAAESGARSGGSTAELSSVHKPFARNFTLVPEEYEANAQGPDEEKRGPIVEESIKDAAASFMRDDDVSAAVSLDKAVNGTSLMMMFEFRKAFLLFPGDAQWGTWSFALREQANQELLARTTFYKVGHHGSHNATPVDFLEKTLGEGKKIWCAAASVRPISFWPEIPRAPLLEALRTHADRVVRSDQPGSPGEGVSVRPGGVDFVVPC
jgi:beta-lactamase superfamily II metal-dependent hydrolase